MLRVSVLVFRVAKIMSQLLASSLIPCQQTTGRVSEVTSCEVTSCKVTSCEVTSSPMVTVVTGERCMCACAQDMKRQVRVSASHMLTRLALNWN